MVQVANKCTVYEAILGVANETRKPRPRLRPLKCRIEQNRASIVRDTPIYSDIEKVIVGRTCMIACLSELQAVTWRMLRFAADVERETLMGGEEKECCKGIDSWA